jgi:Cu(I)/Ag(I) efflux system periplasmic protein CusF
VNVHLYFVLSIAILAAPYTIAQAAGTGSLHPVQATARTDTSEMSEGEVRKVDKTAGKITLRHGEIRNLDMPSMTMVFLVKDKSMLDKVKTGDKVRFLAEKSNGTLVVTALEAAK